MAENSREPQGTAQGSSEGPQTAQEGRKEEPRKKRWPRNRWIIVGVCVCALVAGIAFLAPFMGQPGTDVASAEETRQATEAPSATPSPSPTRTPTPTPKPTPTPEPKVADFTKAAIVGSSTTQGLYMYGTLPEPDYYYHTSLTLQGLYDTVMDGASKPIIEALGDKPYDQIFLAFGLNELGLSVDTFLQQYEQVIQKIREEQPQAVIYIESLLPVGPITSARNRFNVNQDRINEFNAALEKFAPEHGVYYLDVSTVFKDENGFLPDAVSADGIHLNQDGCAIWADALRTGVTDLLNSEDGPLVPDISSMAPSEAPAAEAEQPAEAAPAEEVGAQAELEEEGAEGAAEVGVS